MQVSCYLLTANICCSLHKHVNMHSNFKVYYIVHKQHFNAFVQSPIQGILK